ncbi:hypothetical protein SAY87_013865 [Trapa incisa]|uniref:TORTIFOLIA1/SINE1-2 N-terminal domain-containing protein n=1 Tax=Trapa incisa TaxID=236973 RepID=A0AAN7KE60_9MYRT|nr:hypothetical protein SAY87_013865 [Trapa incisa]
MSPQKIKSPSDRPHELKSRVICCLNKLSDRDTLSIGATELDSIARNLTPDSFSPFLACILNTDDSTKCLVRRQCVRILVLLSHYHGDSLSPHVSKMAAIIVRRLRDPDSAVRSACVAAAAAIAAKVTRPPSSALLKSLSDSLATERDANSQIGAALCVAAAVEAAPEPEMEQLRRLLQNARKLLRSEGFKAKAAVLGMVGSIVGVSRVISRGVLDWLVPLVTQFLSSDDWAARKAAAEMLGNLAVAQRELAVEHIASCLKSLEARKFDKVKIVRETIDRSLELWKEAADASDEASIASSRSSSSSPSGGVQSCSSSSSKSSHDASAESSVQRKPVSTSRTSPWDASSKRGIPQKTNINKTIYVSSKLNKTRSSSCSIVLAVPQLTKSVSDTGLNESGHFRPKTKRDLFRKIEDERVQNFAASFPHPEPQAGALTREASDKDCDDDEEVQNFSMVRKQLAQIEHQQSNLFELLRKFMGSYRNGITYLETRTQGLEMALEEMSFDMGLPSGRFANRDSLDDFLGSSMSPGLNVT